MTSVDEDYRFAKEVFGEILEKVIDWISGNLSPDEVFNKDDLIEWAQLEGISEIFEKEIEDQIEKAWETKFDSKYPSMTYEQGILVALNWVLGNSDDLPMEE